MTGSSVKLGHSDFCQLHATQHLTLSSYAFSTRSANFSATALYPRQYRYHTTKLLRQRRAYVASVSRPYKHSSNASPLPHPCYTSLLYASKFSTAPSPNSFARTLTLRKAATSKQRNYDHATDMTTERYAQIATHAFRLQHIPYSQTHDAFYSHHTSSPSVAAPPIMPATHARAATRPLTIHMRSSITSSRSR